MTSSAKKKTTIFLIFGRMFDCPGYSKKIEPCVLAVLFHYKTNEVIYFTFSLPEQIVLPLQGKFHFLRFQPKFVFPLLCSSHIAQNNAFAH